MRSFVLVCALSATALADSALLVGRVEGGKVTFAPVEELRPGESAVFVVEAEAAAVGDARFRAEVRAGHLNNPLREEQSVRVVGGR